MGSRVVVMGLNTEEEFRCSLHCVWLIITFNFYVEVGNILDRQEVSDRRSNKSKSMKYKKVWFIVSTMHKIQRFENKHNKLFGCFSASGLAVDD